MIRPFDIATEVVGGVGVVRVSGDLDGAESPTLRLALISTAQSTSGVVIDLSECEFIGSSGIAVIVEAWRGLDGRRPENLVLAAPNGQVDRIIRVAGLDAVIAIFDRVDEALASLASGEPEPSPTEKRAS